jgi:hypothetical protein
MNLGANQHALRLFFIHVTEHPALSSDKVLPEAQLH